jgi:hypothetical protein
MKRALPIFGVAVALAVTWWNVSARNQEKQAKTKPVTFVSADEAKFKEEANL